MSATVIFSARAERHIENIALELADRSRRLSSEFVREVRARVEQLAQFPESGVVWDDDVRRLVLRRSHYSLFSVFDEAQNVVTVIACYHDRSDPANWRF